MPPHSRSTCDDEHGKRPPRPRLPSNLLKFAAIVTLAKTIVAMWRLSQSNGISEDFHRKMKPIQRQAYGFKKLEDYHLRAIVECD